MLSPSGMHGCTATQIFAINLEYGKIETIYTFLQSNKWVLVDDPEEQISFLASGEYNENYHIRIAEIYGQAEYVFRINHGSQLGLKNQIEYEFAVLRALSRSGVTPRPYYCDPEPEIEGLGNGVLLMEYLPGRPLEYEKDWRTAASIFATTHSQPVRQQLIEQRNPVLDIARESKGLIHRYPEHPLTREKDILLAYHEKVLQMAAEAEVLFANDPPVLVNTEVNSHNFIIDDESGRGWLVDWEKAVFSTRYQDLAHFLVPTTTLWKTDFRFSEKEQRQFVATYLEAASLDTDIDTAMRCVDIMQQTILLRAMAWCYMAYHEYTESDRALKNADTFTTIQKYLDEMECFFEPKT